VLEAQRLCSLPSAAAQVKALRAALGPERAQSITTAKLQRVVKQWQQARHPVSDATINPRLALLRRAYALGKLCLDPVVLDFSDLLLVESSPLGKHIDAPAFATISAHLLAALRPFFAFAYLCGTRKASWHARPGHTGTRTPRSSPGPRPR
jgi:hypothetical protein